MFTSFQKESNHGGVLLPILCVLVMLSMLTLFVLEDYRQKQLMTQQLIDYYVAEAVLQKEQEQVNPTNRYEKRQVLYNVGHVTIAPDNTKLFVDLKITMLDGYKRTFNKKIR